MNLFNKIFGHAKSHQQKVKYASTDYNQYFNQSTINNFTVEYKHLGDLNISTGRIVACDPLVSLCDTPPFTRVVEQGQYPVVACVAKIDNSKDRHALVKLEFSNAPAVKWEMALLENQDVDSLTDENEFFGFPVDAGLACFCDVSSQKSYNQFDENFMIKNPKGNIYQDHLEQEFKKNCHPNNTAVPGDWLNFYIPHQPDENVIMFNSGYGDGIYPCYWGIAADDSVCSLIVDFLVFDR